MLLFDTCQNGTLRHAHGYYSSHLGLSPLAEKNVRFCIGIDTSYDDYGWFSDNARICICLVLEDISLASLSLVLKGHWIARAMPGRRGKQLYEKKRDWTDSSPLAFQLPLIDR